MEFLVLFCLMYILFTAHFVTDDDAQTVRQRLLTEQFKKSQRKQQ